MYVRNYEIWATRSQAETNEGSNILMTEFARIEFENSDPRFKESKMEETN